jgi:hypothetical protein
MTDHPRATVTPTEVADVADLVAELRAARAEEDRIRQLRAEGQAGYADAASAAYRTVMALQRCRDAGLYPTRFTVDIGSILGPADPGDGTYRCGS